MVSSWSKRLFAACALVVFSAASLSFAQTVSYTSTLSGANEVPANASTATGNTLVTINPTTGVVNWNTASSILQASSTGHHIHRGAAGTNGPVIINFNALYAGTVTVAPALAAEIVANPAGFYVNLHTAAFPGGEIRAQLAAIPTPGSVPALALPLLGLLGLGVAGLGAFVFRRSKNA
jgi:hypothetical protein